MNTAVLLLRAAELNLDLNEITVGMLLDIITEKQNDSYDWPEEATDFSMLKR